ncbi:terminase family protein [Providencia sp.]|uniref:terminase large subunit domain-containing protein n=1 Tax=Providencia sp. TaxID=589 RepID=UPI00294185AE|nr:terminase family protein [Providencia rettgeri]
MSYFRIEVTNNLLIELACKMQSDLNEWQKRWSYNQFHKNRVLDKARQIGADWYFTLEALNDACLTGRNKIFISDENLIEQDIAYTFEHAGITCSLEKAIKQFYKDKRIVITLSNGANIYFISSKSFGFAAICGDVYAPEWSWDDKPIYLLNIVAGITTHYKWRRTFYSTRSINDEATKQGVDQFDVQSQMSQEYTYHERITELQTGLPIEAVRKGFIKASEKLKPEIFAEMYLCQFPCKW